LILIPASGLASAWAATPAPWLRAAGCSAGGFWRVCRPGLASLQMHQGVSGLCSGGAGESESQVHVRGPACQVLRACSARRLPTHRLCEDAALIVVLGRVDLALPWACIGETGRHANDAICRAGLLRARKIDSNCDCEKQIRSNTVWGDRIERHDTLCVLCPVPAMGQGLHR
jgi:hypothetical protein